MAGSLADHDALCLAYARSLLAEAAFDAKPTPEREREATLAYCDMVSAACRVDPHALRSDSIRKWIERRCELYAANCATNWRV